MTEAEHRDALEEVRRLAVQFQKHEQIRINNWIRKLHDHTTSNSVWKRNAREYAMLLLRTLQGGFLTDPFLRMPPQGPLPVLPRYMVSPLLGDKAPLRKKLEARDWERTSTGHNRGGIRRLGTDRRPCESNNEKEMSCKQVQTVEADDQSEWQRIWKHAFEKLHAELKQKTASLETLESELQNAHYVLKGYKKSLEKMESDQTQCKMQHEAALEQLRAVHMMEMDELKETHRKQMQEAVLQNEDRLLRKYRNDLIDATYLAALPTNTGAKQKVRESEEFLAYIDKFYEETRSLTRSV